MYAQSEQLDQIEKQAASEFHKVITHFEWVHEDNFTTIIVEIRDTALQIPIMDRIREIIDSIIGDQSVVDLLVRPVESVNAFDGLFNLTYEGGIPYFIIDYYAPECESSSSEHRSSSFMASIDYYTMIEAIHTIHLDSAEQVWDRLFRPIHSQLAKKAGIKSFSKSLAPDVRDFLLSHLDFIKHIADAKGDVLQILEPAPQVVSLPSSPLANGHQQPAARKRAVASQQELALPTAVAA